MNGDSRRKLAVALASFAIGITVAAVLGSPKAREKITEQSKKLLHRIDN
jgi:hypothetical protein